MKTMLQMLHRAVIEEKKKTCKLTDRIRATTEVLGLLMGVPRTDAGRVQMAAALLTAASIFIDKTGFDGREKEKLINTFASAGRMVEQLRMSMN